MWDSIDSNGSGVVHGHIHNYNNLTYIHGHVHHTTDITDDLYNNNNNNNQNQNRNTDGNNDTLLIHEKNIQLPETCKSFEFFDFHNNNNNNNVNNAYNIFYNDGRLNDHRSNSPLNSIQLDLPFNYHHMNSDRTKRKFEELDDNILSNASLKRQQQSSTTSYDANNIEDYCNPKIFEICCDIDHDNSTLSPDLRMTATDNVSVNNKVGVGSFNKDGTATMHTLKNDMKLGRSDQNRASVNFQDLQSQIKCLSDLNCTFDCDGVNKEAVHRENGNGTGQLSIDSYTMNPLNDQSDSFDRYCVLCAKNEAHEEHKYDARTGQDTPCDGEERNKNKNKNNDTSILQDLCSISSLYEVPLAQHMSHFHSHSHDQEREKQNEDKGIMDSEGRKEYDGSSKRNDSASNLLGPVINCSLINKIPTNSKDNHTHHHHHKIELHTHAPMINNYTVLDNKTRQTILNNAINFHIDCNREANEEGEEMEYRLNKNDMNDMNELNTIDFNWNYRRDKDKDMRCLWDDCSDGDKLFDNLIDLQKHMFVDHIPEDADYTCHWQDCLFQGDDVCSLVNHINDQHGINFGIKVKESKIHLPVIETMEKRRKKKKEEEEEDITLNENECRWGECHMRFNSKKELNEHIELIHIPRRKSQYRCNWDECNKMFNQRQKMLRHIKVHTGYRPFKCEVCNKTFANQETLIQHKRIHSGEKPYKCGICGKCFGGSSSLKIHIRIHTGEKPLKCSICGKRFNESSNLNKHLKTHVKKFCCEKCGKKFSTAKYLKQHESSMNCIKENKFLNV